MHRALYSNWHSTVRGGTATVRIWHLLRLSAAGSGWQRIRAAVYRPGTQANGTSIPAGGRCRRVTVVLAVPRRATVRTPLWLACVSPAPHTGGRCENGLEGGDE